MSSGQRFEQLTIAPFSELTGSDGRPCVFHPAISASDVMIESTFASGFIGTGWPPAAVRRYGSHVSSSSAMRNGLVNGPMYEMNADASSTSPTSSSPAAWRSVMPFAQRTSSEPSAAVRRCARSSLSWPFSANSTASRLSFSALLYSSVRMSSCACSSATCSFTIASSPFAFSSSSVDSCTLMRFGSTSIQMS